jgi:iron(III) transport system substrate-binding protein
MGACGGGGTPETSGGEDFLTIYSGREQDIAEEAFEEFEKATGIEVRPKYAEASQLVAQLLEEGDRSPADVFYALDPGSLGALARKGRFARLPEDLLSKVPARWRDPNGTWLGTSLYARVVGYNPDEVKEADLPDSILDFTAARWKGKVGWAPTQGSFQIFVTALRRLKGESVARRWLQGMKDNDAKPYPSNDAIATAISSGEIETGFVNHYYLFEIREFVKEPHLNVKFFTNGDPGGIVVPAGAGVLRSSDKQPLARRFVEFLLSEEGQEFAVKDSFEYPIDPAAKGDSRLPPLSSLNAPPLQVSELSDLDGTVRLLREVGLI